MIELCTLMWMAVTVVLRMTVLANAVVYRNNSLMNANLFALGAAFFLFGLFNWIFVGGFFKTAYKTGKPFMIFMIVSFLSILVFEALHHVPGMEVLNSFGMDAIGIQVILLAAGIAAWLFMTILSCIKACAHFENIDL